MGNALRIGHGFDIHKFKSGRPLYIGGVLIPGEDGLDGHSDADVLLHAVIDSLLGAAGRGDIGTWFPNTDEKWLNSKSRDLLAFVWEALKKEGVKISNIDCTILAEKPRLMPHASKMKEVIGETLNIGSNQIGIKATTCEGLGAIGRGEGIAAFAVALIEI